MSPGTIRPSHLAVIGAVAIGGIFAVRATTPASASSAQASNVIVDCEPSQQALVRQIASRGEPQFTVQCVTNEAAQPVAYVDASGRIVPTAHAAMAPGVIPAVYTVPAQPAPVAARAPATRRVDNAPEAVTTPSATATTSATTTPSAAPSTTTAPAGEPKRSWKKTAVVVGGSAGAGAGIGAIIGGKKGAAIGAAIGGGAGAIYEAIKR
jgi:hypothetical protein